MQLFEKGLAIDEVVVDMAKREHKGEPYRALNPYGRVPTLVDGDFVLYESSAIMDYLELLHPTPALLPPSAQGRALVSMHIKLCDLEIDPAAQRRGLDRALAGAAERARYASERVTSALLARVGNVPPCVACSSFLCSSWL